MMNERTYLVVSTHTHTLVYYYVLYWRCQTMTEYCIRYMQRIMKNGSNATTLTHSLALKHTRIHTRMLTATPMPRFMAPAWNNIERIFTRAEKCPFPSSIKHVFLQFFPISFRFVSFSRAHPSRLRCPLILFIHFLFFFFAYPLFIDARTLYRKMLRCSKCSFTLSLSRLFVLVYYSRLYTIDGEMIERIIILCLHTNHPDVCLLLLSRRKYIVVDTNWNERFWRDVRAPETIRFHVCVRVRLHFYRRNIVEKYHQVNVVRVVCSELSYQFYSNLCECALNGTVAINLTGNSILQHSRFDTWTNEQLNI